MVGDGSDQVLLDAKSAIVVARRDTGGRGDQMGNLSIASGDSGLSKSIAGLSKSSPGLTPVWQTAEWHQANEWNDEGSRLVHHGDLDAGLSLLSQAARFGLPWALASFTWRCLLDGDWARGLTEFHTAQDACIALSTRLTGDAFLASTARVQLANARSNAALLMIASGRPLVEAAAIWAADVDSGNVESAFYPAMVAALQGDQSAADELVRGLPISKWLEVRGILREHASAHDWYGQWCLSGLELLERNAPDLTLPGLGELSVDEVRNRPPAYLEPVEEGLWDAVNRAIAEDPQAESDLRRFAEGPSTTAWIAKSELGCLLIGDALDSSRVEEGRQLLILCLDAPYRDVVATSAWNLAELLRSENRQDVAAGLYGAAVELGDGTALRVTAERLLAEGQSHEAMELLERAVAELPRGDANRVAARVTLARMSAEDVPVRFGDWFVQHQGALAARDWSAYITACVWAGDFNVDVARAAISTGYFEDCPAQCFHEPSPYDCGDCGRGPTTFLGAASGKGDGGYLALTLLGDLGDGQLDPVGVFVPFMPDDLDGLELFSPGDRVLDVVVSSAPIVLGTLSSAGELIVADSAKSMDNPDVAARIEVPPGDYVVVCFLRPEIDPVTVATALASGSSVGDPLTCVALAAVRGPLAEVLLNLPDQAAPAVRDALLHDLWGDDSRSVAILVTDIRPQVLQRMIEAQSTLQDADSFMLQMAERTNDGQDAMVAVQRSGRTGSAETLELLAQRGFAEPLLPWWQDDLATAGDDIWAPVLRARQQTAGSADDWTDAAISSVWGRRALAARLDVPDALVADLTRDPDTRVRVNLAANQALSAQRLAALTADTEPAVLSALAGNPNTPMDVLHALTSLNRSPKGALAHNANTPATLLGQVVADATKGVRSTVANRPDLPAALAEQLATDKPDVRTALASNPAVPADVLAALASDSSVWTRSRVARNPSTPPVTLIKLSLDEDEFVRESVMDNPAAPDEAKAQASLMGVARPA